MKVSVITTTYNSANTLQFTLDSVFCQTYRDFELIIVDGASSDDTLDIIKEYEHKYNGRLKWISEPDNGLYYAMNKGLLMATGDVVGFLNSDDFYTSPNVLRRIAEEIMDKDAVFGDIHFVHGNNLKKCERYYSSKLFRKWMMRLGFMPAHPSFYCKRSVYERLGGFDTEFKVAADFELLLRYIYLNNISIKYIPMDFVTMRLGGASTSGLKSHKLIYHEHMQAYEKNGLKGNFFLESLRYLYKIGELASSRLKN